MNLVDQQIWILLSVQLLALAIGTGFLFTIRYLQRRAKKLPSMVSPAVLFETVPQRPMSWLAIRAASPEIIQQALGLNRPMPCSWSDGMTGGHEFFISPRINGWVIVTGMGLPCPGDDVDACFHFLISLSRKLGHVQFFYAEKFSLHHAWMRLDDGCVTRAYAWAGKTIWNQGNKTVSETELKLKCFSYEQEAFSAKVIMENFERVPLLATRWSLDPARIRTLKKSDGIAGESSRVY